MNLVILESPGKVGTVKSYLGSSYKVMASIGHVRDLPKSSLGIDIENGFEPHYINIRGKGELIKELKREAGKADRVYLATDPDREGEAIAWHLAAALKLPDNKIRRVTFNEITKSAVKESIKSPRDININLVNAQQARRILDRIVGYKISPFLWKNVRSGLSAGRVQSVATKIIVDRENEIRAFVPREYWTVDARLGDGKEKEFTVHYHSSSASGEKTELSCESEAAAVVNDCIGRDFTVKDIRRGSRSKSPAPPFSTSTLLQEASRKLNFQSQRTMRVAQELYEGIKLGSGGAQGLITYMRTDSLRVSEEARNAAREYVAGAYGEKYVPDKPRVYKTSAGAEDAHEAIRPSNVNLDPTSVKKYLSADQYKLYRLIWNRFVASQMASAELATVSAEFICGKHLFKASGYTVKFSGYMAVYEESSDTPDNEKGVKLPDMETGEMIPSKEVIPERHFTEPPARFNEGSLVKFLKEKGIGRPSTYTPIITTIISRGYVRREGKALVPTELGEVTTRIMEESFPDIVNYKFTADMEERLDGVEAGSETIDGVLTGFWGGFSKELEEAQQKADEGSYELPTEETDLICENCGAKMVVKNGRFGKFAACPNYPKCKNTKPLAKPDAEQKTLETAPFKCELCGSDMVLRTGKYGGFYACVRYPECKFTKQKAQSLGVPCPKCGKDIVAKHGRNRALFYSCSGYPECDFSSWDMPSSEKCPDCGGMLFVKKGKAKNYLVCKSEGCGYRKEITELDKINPRAAGDGIPGKNNGGEND